MSVVEAAFTLVSIFMAGLGKVILMKSEEPLYI